MSNTRKGRRLLIAGILAATAAIGSSAPAQADAGDKAAKCEVRLDRLEAQFYAMEERHGWYEAAEWWDARWKAYYQSCVV